MHEAASDAEDTEIEKYCLRQNILKADFDEPVSIDKIKQILVKI